MVLCSIIIMHIKKLGYISHLLAEPLRQARGTLGFRGTHFGKRCSRLTTIFLWLFGVGVSEFYFFRKAINKPQFPSIMRHFFFYEDETLINCTELTMSSQSGTDTEILEGAGQNFWSWVPKNLFWSFVEKLMTF
jgi:hypothetical protein